MYEQQRIKLDIGGTYSVAPEAIIEQKCTLQTIRFGVLLTIKDWNRRPLN